MTIGSAQEVIYDSQNTTETPLFTYLNANHPQLVTPSLKNDLKTQLILGLLFANEAFCQIFQSASKQFKWGVTILSRGVSGEEDPLRISNALTQRIKSKGKTISAVIEYNKAINYIDALRALIFEVVNCTRDEEYDKLTSLALSGRISRNDYAKSKERIEWNALKVCRSIEHSFPPGIARNIDERQYNNFEYHLEIQEACGHTEVYRKEYDRLTKGKVFNYNKSPSHNGAKKVAALVIAFIGFIGLANIFTK